MTAEEWERYEKGYDEGRGHPQVELEPARKAFAAGFAAGRGDMRKNREQIVAEARRQRDEIAQMFLDIASWNDNGRKPGDAPIDPDPDGVLKELQAGLDRFLADEDARRLPEIWKPEVVQRARDAHASLIAFRDLARGAQGAARANFRTTAAPIIAGDHELQAQADALEQAIGEVSVDEALGSLRRFKDERRQSGR